MCSHHATLHWLSICDRGTPKLLDTQQPTPGASPSAHHLLERLVYRAAGVSHVARFAEAGGLRGLHSQPRISRRTPTIFHGSALAPPALSLLHKLTWLVSPFPFSHLQSMPSILCHFIYLCLQLVVSSYQSLEGKNCVLVIFVFSTGLGIYRIEYLH